MNAGEGNKIEVSGFKIPEKTGGLENLKEDVSFIKKMPKGIYNHNERQGFQKGNKLGEKNKGRHHLEE